MRVKRAGVPAVRYPCGRDSMLAALLVGVWLLGALACLGVIVTDGSEQAGWRPAALGLVLLLSAAALLRFWLAQVERELQWDGAAWTVSDPGSSAQAPLPVDVVWVALDGQRHLLLGARLAGAGPRRIIWLWTRATRDPARWVVLRAAVVHARSADGADAGVAGIS